MIYDGLDQVRIKPLANDLNVEMRVEGAEQDGKEYIIDTSKKAPQDKIIVSGYGKENVYEVYVRKNKKEAIAKWEFNEAEGDMTKDEAGYTEDAYVGETKWVEGVDGSAIEFAGERSEERRVGKECRSRR